MCAPCRWIWLQIYVRNHSVTATAVTELIPLFSGHVIVSCVWLEPATYCVLVPHSAESLSTAIIPSKTSAVIPAMFHQSVAVYSKAHCLSMLASTKIIACECLCAFLCACAHCYPSFAPNLLSFPWTNTSKRSWADKFAFLQCCCTTESGLQFCVCVCLNN